MRKMKMKTKTKRGMWIQLQNKNSNVHVTDVLKKSAGFTGITTNVIDQCQYSIHKYCALLPATLNTRPTLVITLLFS